MRDTLRRWGAFIPIVSIPMAAVMVGAIVTVHWPFGFSSIKLQEITSTGPKFGPTGYEVPLLYLACLARLVVGGSGPYSLGIRGRKQ